MLNHLCFKVSGKKKRSHQKNMLALREGRHLKDMASSSKIKISMHREYVVPRQSAAYVAKINSAEKHEILPSATDESVGRTQTLWLVNTTFLVL